MIKKANNEEVDAPEPSKILKANQDIKRAPLFSHYIWTHDIHSIAKVAQSEHERPEDAKIVPSKSQGLLDRYQSSSLNKKTDEIHAEEEEDDDKGRSKPLRRKNNSIEKLTGYLENVDRLITQRKPDNFIQEKVEEMTKEIKQKRTFGLSRFQDMYVELFGSKQELPPLTSKRNQEFLEKINEIQRELRPEKYRRLAAFDNNALKFGNKAKPAKVSVEPLQFNSSRTKIMQVKEIEARYKLKTNRDTLKKIPFTVGYI